MSSAPTLREAEQYFHDRIPLTRAMGVRVVVADQGQFVVEAPVSLNSNHLGTAFGGSINAVALLAAYGLLWSAVRERNLQVVVVESSIQFQRPVRDTIRAVCSRPSLPEWQKFQEEIESTGRARITLLVEVVEGDQIAARLTGIFLARTG